MPAPPVPSRVDEPNTGRQPGAALVMAAAVTLLVPEGLLAFATSRGLGLTATLGWHLAVVGAATVALLRSEWRQSRYGVLLVMATAAFGPLGPAGTVMAIGMERYHARRATSPEEWHASLFPPSEVDEREALWRRIGQRAHDQASTSSVTPFLDVLAFGSVPQRQAVVAVIVQQFDPAFAPALRAALRDPHNVVRVQAATAIARLEQECFERTLALEADVARHPDDPDAVLALAVHCDQQAFAGLFDPAREQDYRVKAAELYGRRLELRPDDLATEYRMARLLMRRGQAADAEPRFRRLADAGYPTAALWLMESQFAQGRYGQVRETAAAVDEAERQRLTPDIQAAVHVWTGSGEAA